MVVGECWLVQEHSLVREHSLVKGRDQIVMQISSVEMQLSNAPTAA